jgi:sec-independent protein translocase protein TatA
MIGDLFDSPWKIAIIAILIIVLFGSRKLPIAARSLGKSMRILKKEVSSLHDDDDDDEPAQGATVQAAPAQLQAPVAPAAASADAQAQIDALSRQLADLQKQSVKTSDSAQAN